MARGFGARESSFAASSAAGVVNSLSKNRSEIDSLRQKYDEAKAKSDAAWKESDARRMLENKRWWEVEKENKERVTQEVRKELGDEFDKWSGERFWEEYDPDRGRMTYENPTKGVEEVDRRMKVLHENDKIEQDAKRDEREASKNFHSLFSETAKAEQLLKAARRDEAKVMEVLMDKVFDENKGRDEGELGDGKVGNGVNTPDGKTRLRIEDFAYLMGSVMEEDFEGAYQGDGENDATVLPQFRSGLRDEIQLPFSFDVERRSRRDDGYVSDVRMDEKKVGKALRDAGFTFDEKDLETFVNGFERVAKKEAPDFESNERYY